MKIKPYLLNYIKNINKGIEPKGSITITENDTYNVKQYAEAVVNVPQIVPTGTINISHNGEYDVTNYANATVNVQTPKIYNCQNLFTQNIRIDELPNLVDLLAPTNANAMFSGASLLTQVPNMDTSECVNMSYAFAYCYGLTSFPALNTSKVTNMSRMLYDCQSITSIGAIDTSTVENFNYAFGGCVALVDFPVLDFSSATDLRYMFQNDSLLSNQSLSNILDSLLTVTNYDRAKTLASLSLSSTQADYIASLPKWSNLQAMGWSKGY